MRSEDRITQAIRKLGEEPKPKPLNLSLAKQVAARADLRAHAIAHHLGNPPANLTQFNAQSAALLMACAGTIDALVKALEDRGRY